MRILSNEKPVTITFDRAYMRRADDIFGNNRNAAIRENTYNLIDFYCKSTEQIVADKRPPNIGDWTIAQYIDCMLENDYTGQCAGDEEKEARHYRVITGKNKHTGNPEAYPFRNETYASILDNPGKWGLWNVVRTQFEYYMRKNGRKIQ